MHIDTVKAVSAQGTMRAAGVATSRKHEVVDNQLAAAIKQVREGNLAVGPFENICFGHLHPWQASPLGTQGVLHPLKLLLFDQKLLACFKPVGLRYHLVL